METRQQRILREAREISEGMKRLDPEKWEAANKLVKRRVAVVFLGEIKPLGNA